MSTLTLGAEGCWQGDLEKVKVAAGDQSSPHSPPPPLAPTSPSPLYSLFHLQGNILTRCVCAARRPSLTGLAAAQREARLAGAAPAGSRRGRLRVSLQLTTVSSRWELLACFAQLADRLVFMCKVQVLFPPTAAPLTLECGQRERGCVVLLVLFYRERNVQFSSCCLHQCS